MEKLAGRVTIALKALGSIQILSSVAATMAVFLFVSHEILDIVGEDIMMPGQAIQILAVLLMLLVTATGIISIFGLPWGWLFSFTVASIVLVMALLMGPGTIPVTKWSFLGLMALSVINWAAAVVYYFHDLYT